MKIRHVGISVKNEGTALKFYSELLGFKVIKKATEELNYAKKILGIFNVTYIKLEKGKDMLELYLMPKDNQKGKWNHIAFTVDNINETYTKLHDEGINFISQPIYDGNKTHKLCFCKDYDGNLIEFVEEIKNQDRKRPEIKDKEKKVIKMASDGPRTRKSRIASPILSQSIKNRGKGKEISEAELNKDYQDAE